MHRGATTENPKLLLRDGGSSSGTGSHKEYPGESPRLRLCVGTLGATVPGGRTLDAASQDL